MSAPLVSAPPHPWRVRRRLVFGLVAALLVVDLVRPPVESL